MYAKFHAHHTGRGIWPMYAKFHAHSTPVAGSGPMYAKFMLIGPGHGSSSPCT